MLSEVLSVLLVFALIAIVTLSVLLVRERRRVDRYIRKARGVDRKWERRSDEQNRQLEAKVAMIGRLRSQIASCNVQKSKVESRLVSCKSTGCMGFRYRRLENGRSGATVMNSMRNLFEQLQDIGCSSKDFKQALDDLSAEAIKSMPAKGVSCETARKIVAESFAVKNGKMGDLDVPPGSINEKLVFLVKSVVNDVITESCDGSGKIDPLRFSAMLHGVFGSLCPAPVS